jgi:hypothetical protein
MSNARNIANVGWTIKAFCQAASPSDTNPVGFNISGFVDEGNGIFTINFENDLNSTDYVFLGNAYNRIIRVGATKYTDRIEDIYSIDNVGNFADFSNGSFLFMEKA